MSDARSDGTREHGSSATAGGPAFSRRALFRGTAAVGAAAGIGMLLPDTAVAARSKFPLGAAAKSSSKPVNITMWHAMTNANLTTLQGLTNAFNASQSNVKVNLVGQNSYTDTLTAYTTALSDPSKLPDLVQWETELIQLLIDSQSIVSVASAMAVDHAFSTKDFVPSMLNFFKVNGTQWALPFNISCQVVYYNETAFTKAGLDPSNPPTTLPKMHAAAAKIVQTGTAKYGMSLKLDNTDFEQWMALGGKDLINKNNGRTGRATAVSFDNALGRSIFGWWANMLKNNVAQSTSNSGSATYDNLLAIGSGIAPMTIDTSAALGTILQVLGSGQYANVKLGVGPMPWPGSKPSAGGGVFVGGAGLYIVKKPSQASQDAAWQFIKFLTEPASQATWSVGTGYVPVRKSAVTVPSLVQAWTAVPEYKVAYHQLLTSPPNAATAGAVTGAANELDTAILDGLTAMANGTPYAQALSQAASAGNAALSSYNERV